MLKGIYLSGNHTVSVFGMNINYNVANNSGGGIYCVISNLYFKLQKFKNLFILLKIKGIYTANMGQSSFSFGSIKLNTADRGPGN